MVIGLEIRQANLDHFNRWPYRSKDQPNEAGGESVYLARQTSQSATSANGVSAINGILGDARNALAEGLDADIVRLPDMNNLLAPFPEPPFKHASALSETHADRSNESAGSPESLTTNITTTGSRSSQTQIRIMTATSLSEGQAENQPYTSPSLSYRASTTFKRRRALHDVDGPGTSHMSCKKRRLRLQLVTSRLSQPFSLPATHILNRESDNDTPVISRFVKRAAIGAKKAGHQTALVRKAAIMNRVRLTIRQTAVTRGHDRIWKRTGWGAMRHGFQLVTDSTGAMFPGRSGEQVPGPIVPRAWRPHTTSTNAKSPPGMLLPGLISSEKRIVHMNAASSRDMPPTSSHTKAVVEDTSLPLPPPPPPATYIMTPLAGADEDEASFPDSDLDSRYTEASDDEMDDVYADFGVLFGGGTDSLEGLEEDEHFYEEYLDEVDGIIWAS